MKASSFRSFAGTAFLIFVLACFVFALPYTSWAQAKSNVIGKVTDAATGEFLPGANVYLQDTNFGAASNAQGEFRINGVPPGTFTLVVNYIGYEEFEVEITVTGDGADVDQDVELASSYVTGDVVTVYGLRQGQIKALSQQRTASNIKNVVDEEQMQRFPDVNSAEVLQRVSGVTVTRDQGEGRYVLVRGTSPRLNSMTINGEKITSPEGDARSVPLDVISADQLKAIEVTKAITPDMDGNAIGGAVELRTKNALDYPGRVFTVNAGSGLNNLSNKGTYMGSFTYGDRFGANKNLGFMMSGSFNRTNRASHNNEVEWGDEETVDEVELPFALRNIDTRLYTIRRDRMTLTGSLDFLPKEGHKLYLTGIYSEYNDREQRRGLMARPEKGDYISATTIEEATFESELKDRDQNQHITNIMAGGDHQFDKFKLDYRFSYSHSMEQEPRYLTSIFEIDEDANLALDASDVDHPQWNVTNLGAGYEYNPANYVLDVFEVDDTKTTDKDIVGGFNVEVPYSIGANSASFKFGAKALMKKKDRNEIIMEYGWEGDDDLLMNQFTDTHEEDNFLEGNYPMPLSPDPDKIYNWFQDNKDSGLLEGENLKEDSDGATYDASEDVIAYYAMTTMNFGKWMLLGGFRHEFTKIKYTGNEVIFDEDGDYEQTISRTNENKYNYILPMVHLRFKPGQNTNMRAAFTTGIARPNYEDLVPFRIVLREDEEIETGNPDLVPTTSSNIDFMLEHYFQGIGLLSGGVFYKSMKDIIFPSYYEIDGGEYDGYEVFQTVQGEDATLFGFELNWQQQLTFLPGFLSGFGVYANYTYTTSTASIAGREDVTLPGQAANTANLALSYEKGGFSSRVSMNYHGKYLEELGEEAEYDIYYDNHIQWDISATQNLFGGLQLYVQAINMSNAPLRYYMGNTNRPTQREFYSWWINAGIKFTR